MVFPVKVLLFSERKERNTNTRSEHRYKHQHARALKIKRKTAGETKTPFFLFQERVVQADSSARKRDERNFSSSSSSSSSSSKAPKKGERIYAQKEDKRPERKTTPRRDV
jgi:hypothetical protein